MPWMQLILALLCLCSSGNFTDQDVSLLVDQLPRRCLGKFSESHLVHLQLAADE